VIPVAANALKGFGSNRNHTNTRTIQLRFKFSLVLLRLMPGHNVLGRLRCQIQPILVKLLTLGMLV
jgi:hypothetical protein